MQYHPDKNIMSAARHLEAIRAARRAASTD